MPHSLDDIGARAAQTAKEYFLGGPKFDDFEIERDRDTGREIEF